MQKTMIWLGRNGSQAIAALLLPLSVNLLGAMPAHAQVTPDGTLSTTVSQTGNQFTIDNGARVGNNLFHSFGQFSVPTNGAAIFNNPTDVQNIFSRVTGGTVSTIDGLIRANGTTSLFLLNPSGILFGSNASLEVGGSFIGTTATSIKFADGTEFSAVNPTASPLLTMSVPVGLQLGQNPGAITVQGLGHQLTRSLLEPIDTSNNPPGLQVAPGNTLALIGGAVTLSGGLLTAASGHIELGSGGGGTVNISAATQGWQFSYGSLQQFNDLSLLQQSFIDASGIPSGSIHLQGRQISLHQGSVALLLNFSNQASGDIRVDASEGLDLQESVPSIISRSLLVSEAVGAGNGGDILVTAPHITLADGGAIQIEAFGSGASGNIIINAVDRVKATGFSSSNPILNSAISTVSSGTGNAGNITFSTGQLYVLDGASIATVTFGLGDSGNNQINASQSIEVIGENPFNFTPSSIATSTFNRGNGGQLIVNTPVLGVHNGGVVVANTLGSGNSGDVIVRASAKIEVSGVGATSGESSRVGARAELLPPVFQVIFGLPPFPTGNSGELTINTPLLEVRDSAFVGVNHDGIGNAGNAQITANRVHLENSGSITASTRSGEGGNINLQVGQVLSLRRTSQISAEASGTGNGGNITLNSPVIVGLENSDIIANAIQGQGGNIQITTQGIFGLKYRPQLTPDNDITASSQFGVNGSVDIVTPGVNPAAALVVLPTTLTDASQQIAQGCASNQDSSFVVTGRGGIPQNPTQDVRDDRPWDDLRDLSAYRKPGNPVAQPPPPAPVILPATSWRHHADGTVELIAAQPAAAPSPVATCSGAAATNR